MPSTYYVAWWNLENLFDEENSPHRTEKLQRTLGIVGWTPARRDKNVSLARQDSPIRAKHGTVEILKFPGTFTGKYKRPKPFGGMGKPIDEDGFSDHFPIGMQVTETD